MFKRAKKSGGEHVTLNNDNRLAPFRYEMV